MAMQPVEWVLVVYYGPEAHRATYGRHVRSNRYTKDYIQLSRKSDFLDAVTRLFVVNGNESASVPITYQWPTGSAYGHFVFRSSDRPHLKWGTSSGAPPIWRMSLTPSDTTSETIPGDPSHHDFDAAENERVLLATRGAGQPYLMAIKLQDQPRTLHLRVYLANPSAEYAWADIRLAPQSIQDLAEKTSQKSALAWAVFQSGGTAPDVNIQNMLSQLLQSDDFVPVIDALDEGTGRALTSYLEQPGYGLFFDPTRNHDAWLLPVPLSEQIAESVTNLLEMLESRYPVPKLGDAAAEKLEVSPEEVDAFREQIEHKNYAVADTHATAKTRGSAQKVFADAVKTNYGFRCAITGIKTKDFLVAAHIVPWSEDQSIRLDPSNGICLSLLVDRAMEKGYLLIEDDLTIRVDWNRVGDDQALRSQLGPYEGQKLNAPAAGAPNPAYLQRRRRILVPTE
jgi:hypothetical protein